MTKRKETMIEREVTVLDMASERERRMYKQHELLKRYNLPLISFTLNIPGAIKTNDEIRRAFNLGNTLIMSTLRMKRFRLLHREEHHAFTGDEAFYVVDAPLKALKQAMLESEELYKIGTLFDIDVISKNGVKVSRTELGFNEKKCLLCSKNAKDCGRNRTHSADELFKEAMRIIKTTLVEYNAQKIVSLALQSILYEIITTPKPGLVDRVNNGSHNDMDVFTFMSSTSSLYPYFTTSYDIGRQTANKDATYTLKLLRDEGKRAELTMYTSTHGVNTHKGVIFIFGIVLGCLGRLSQKAYTLDDVYSEIRAMCKDILRSDYANLNDARTNGERLFLKSNIRGVRGEAENGFDVVRNISYPILKDALKKGYDINSALSITLLYIIKSIDDTVLIARSSEERAKEVKDEISALLQKNPYPTMDDIESLDREFIKDNLSSGGSADLLSLTYFLYTLDNEVIKGLDEC